VREGVRRQTVIWRQLLAGDKAPEAYLDGRARAGPARRPAAAGLAALPALVGRAGRRAVRAAISLPHLINLYETGFVRTGLASALVAVAGAVGITKASVLLTVRGRLDQWSELLWNRALAQRVVEATLTLDVVLPPPARERRLGTAVPERVGRRFRRPAGARPQPVRS
jgi:hypothetical protein